MRLKWMWAFSIAVLLQVVPALHAAPAGDPRMYVTPSEPVARTEGWWMARHEAVLRRIHEGPVGMVLIGDSITQNYEKSYDGTHGSAAENFQPIWQRYYAPRHAVNEGFSGDTTSNVLWRIAHGELDGIHPKLVMVLIGTNNTDMDTSDANTRFERTVSGIEAVVKAIRGKLPSTQILLVGILPSDRSREKSEADFDINEDLGAKFESARGIVFRNVSGIFGGEDGGRLKTALYYDPGLTPAGRPLHPNSEGQRLLAEALEPTVARLTDEPKGRLAASNGLPPMTQLRITAEGKWHGGLSGEETDTGQCGGFRLSRRQARHYLSSSPRTIQMFFGHHATMSPCSVEGTAAFTDGRRAQWYIEEEGRGTVTFTTGEEVLLYCPECVGIHVNPEETGD